VANSGNTAILEIFKKKNAQQIGAPRGASRNAGMWCAGAVREFQPGGDFFLLHQGGKLYIAPA
jgi:hypothetical protein